MAELGLTQIQVLKEFLDDPDGRFALKFFLDKSTLEYAERCKNAMLQGDEKAARENAFRSEAYREMLPLLQSFAVEALRKGLS